MADDTISGEGGTDRKLHSDLLSVVTTGHQHASAQQPLPEPPQRSISKISVPPSAGRLIPGYQLGRYELLCPIARGGMASVWVARLQGAHGFEKLVAIKTILAEHASDPEYEAMFLDEARIVAGIRHHNVAEILDLGSADGLLYLVLEWVEGDSLALLERASSRHKEPIPMTVAMRIVAQICAGLHAAHELSDRGGKPLNVVHRDVSPQNVLVGATGEVKLIDFGIAKAVDQLSENTRTGVVKGKISFMSPEQALGQRVDRRADVWAAGVVLYQLLSGRLPFRGENQLETLHLIGSKQAAPPIAGLPKPLAALLARALEPELDRRIASAAELEVELEGLIALLGPVTTRDVSAVVQQHLGRRIAARREVVDTALRAADGRIKLTQAFNAAMDRDAHEEDSSEAARRREVTTALEPLPKLPAVATLPTFDSAAPTPLRGVTALSRVPRILRQRPWLPSAALVLIVGTVAAMSLHKPASGNPESGQKSAQNRPVERTREPLPPTPSAASPLPTAVAESPLVPPDAPAVEPSPSPSASSQTKSRKSRAPAPPVVHRAAPEAPGKQDVLKAFSVRR